MKRMYLLFFVIIFLCACGRNESMENKSTNEKSVISSENEKNKSTMEKNIIISENEKSDADSKQLDSFSNSKFIFVNDELGIKQYLINGEFFKIIEIENNPQIHFVDEKNIYYSIPDPKNEMGAEIYSVSLKDYSIEYILTEEDGIFFDQFFVSNNYLCYVTRIHMYKEFDLKNKAEIIMEKIIKANCEVLCMDSEQYIMGRSIFLDYREKGVYLHTIGTKEMSYVSGNHLDRLCIYEDRGFYLSESGDIMQIEYYKDKINNSVLMDSRDIKKICKKYKIVMEEYYIEELLICDNKLYIHLENKKKEENGQNVFVVNL